MAQRRRVEDGIAESTLHLLRTGGPRAVTVEAVAAHSGIAKTTIYRRHPNRRDMLSSALSQVASPAPLEPQTEAPVARSTPGPHGPGVFRLVVTVIRAQAEAPWRWSSVPILTRGPLTSKCQE